LQRLAPDEDAGFYDRLVVRPPGTEVRIGFVRIPCRKSLWWFEDEQGKLHQRFSLGKIVSAFALLNV
jgi:hypothetical protein